MNVQEMREKRIKVQSAGNDIVARAKENGWDAELREQFDRNQAEFDELNADIKREELAQARAMDEAKKAESTPQRKETENDRIRRYLLNPQNAVRPDLEGRAVGTSTSGDGYGGYTIDSVIGPDISKAMSAYGGIFGPSRIYNTPKGNQIEWPTLDDTSNSGALEPEAAALTDSPPATDPAFGQVLLNAYKYNSGMIKVNRELIEDSEFDIAQFILRDVLYERVMRKLNSEATLADGSSKPQGAVTAAVYGHASDDTLATYSDIVSAVHSLNYDYRRNGTVMVSDGGLAELRKVVGSDGHPVFQVDPTGAAPGTILGLPVVVNNSMADPAAAAKWMLVGDFSRFVIRMVGNFRLIRVDELYAANDQIGLVVLARMDSALLNSGAIKYVYKSAT